MQYRINVWQDARGLTNRALMDVQRQRLDEPWEDVPHDDKPGGTWIAPDSVIGAKLTRGGTYDQGVGAIYRFNPFRSTEGRGYDDGYRAGYEDAREDFE